MSVNLFRSGGYYQEIIYLTKESKTGSESEKIRVEDRKRELTLRSCHDAEEGNPETNTVDRRKSIRTQIKCIL